nr:putative ribonuclease H-like domain-containing protein [Tanacetum cinerariifolium]
MPGDDNHDGDHLKTSNTSPPVPPPIQQIPHTISSIKLPILKKVEYDIWAMKMEHYLSHTNYLIRKVVQNGNGPVFITTDTNGMIKFLLPKTAEEVVARERKEKQKGLHKGYDRFQTILSQLEIHDAGVSHKDANQKFLKSLPFSWSQVDLIMRTKPGLDTLSFADLYNNLRVFKRDIKGTTASSSNTQNVAFVFADNTSSTNDVSTPYNVSSPSVSKSQKEGSSSYTNKVIHSFIQINQVVMISMRIKKFHKRTGRKLAKGNQDSRRRDAGYNGNKTRHNGRRPAYQDDSKALVTIYEEDIDWFGRVEEDGQNYAMMAYSSSNLGSNNECRNHSLYISIKKVEAQLLCHQQNQLAYEQKIRFMKIDLDDKTGVLAYHKKLLAEALKEKEDLKPKFENWQNYSKNHSRLINTQMSANDKFGLRYGDYRYGSILSYENEVLQSVFMNKVSDQEDTSVNDRYANGMHVVTPPMTWNYMPFGLDVEIDYKFAYGPKQTSVDESDSKTSEYVSRKSVSSIETTTYIPEPVENAPMVVCKPKVWTDAPIIEEYESDSDNDSVENVKEIGTPNYSPKVEKQDRNGYTRKGLGYAFTRNACFVCGSFSNLIRDCDFHEKRMAKQAELTKSKNKKGKQHKASCKTKIVSSMNNPLQILHMDLFRLTSDRIQNNELIEFCGLKGINREYSNARTPQQNGVAKRKNTTLIEVARTMLADLFLPTTFWAEAVNTACYVLNRVLVTKPQNKTPYEILTENQANKSAGPKEANNSAGTQANDDQSANSEEIDLHEEHFVLPIWFAYSTTVKSSGDKIKKTTDFKTCEKPISQVKQIFLKELEKLKRQEKEANDTATPLSKEATHDIQNANTSSTNLLNTVSTPICTAGPSRAFNDGEPSYLDDPSIPHFEDIYAVQTRSKVNKNFEAHALVFALVARIEALRIFLASVSYMGFIVYQIDMKSAFLHSTIDEEVYASQPPGFIDPKFTNKVYKVVKAIYGLHQAPRAWYATLSTFLEKSGYRRGAIDKTLIIKQGKKDIMLVQLYVYDIIFGSTKKSWCDEFEELMKNSMKTASTRIETQKPLVKDEEAVDVDISGYSKDFTPSSFEENL